MADMTPLTDILNDDPATATPVQNNFQTIEAYINGTDLVRTDGTEVMTADLDMDGNTLLNISTLDMNATKITGLADGTADGDAVNYGQLTQDDSPLPLGKVAYAARSSSQAGSGASLVDITSLSATWTAVAARLYRVTLHVPSVTTIGAPTLYTMQLTDSSNTQVQVSYEETESNSIPCSLHLEWCVTGLSGAVTYKGRMKSGGSTYTIASAATSPSFILVEDIGLA